jgi:predicted Fe-Mo cluster-binding NifX family protein
MRIAVSANSGDPDAEFSARFGRCRCFLVADTDSGDWQEVNNPAIDAQGGAGTQVVQLLANMGVDAVVSGRYGPNAYDALQAAGINAYLAKGGSPRKIVADCQGGGLAAASGPSGGGFHGGQGRGRGGRGGGGRGMGRRGQGGLGQGGQGGQGQGDQW